MKRSINLTIDVDLYKDLENLPRKASVSEITNFLLMGYVEMFKKGRMLTDEEIDVIVKRCGGEEFRERMRAVFGPTFDLVDTMSGHLKGLFKKNENGVGEISK